MKLRKLLSAFITTTAAVTIAASSAGAVGIGHSVNGVRFTVTKGEGSYVDVNFDHFGKLEDYDMHTRISSNDLEEGDYYFYAEKDPDKKIRQLFEKAVIDSELYYIDDYEVIDLDCFTSDGDRVYPDIRINFTFPDSYYFNCALTYVDGEFVPVDYHYHFTGNDEDSQRGIQVRTSTPQKLIVARLFYTHNGVEKEDIWKIDERMYDYGSGIEYEKTSMETSDEDIVTNDKETSVIDKTTDISNNGKSDSGKIDAPEISDLKKLTPDGKPADTGETENASAVVVIIGSLALVTACILAVLKPGKAK